MLHAACNTSRAMLQTGCRGAGRRRRTGWALGVGCRSGRGPPLIPTEPSACRSLQHTWRVERFATLRRWVSDDGEGRRDGQANPGRTHVRFRRVSGGRRDRDRRHGVGPLNQAPKPTPRQDERANRPGADTPGQSSSISVRQNRLRRGMPAAQSVPRYEPPPARKVPTPPNPTPPQGECGKKEKGPARLAHAGPVYGGNHTNPGRTGLSNPCKAHAAGGRQLVTPAEKPTRFLKISCKINNLTEG